jgi:hypothetical protein
MKPTPEQERWYEESVIELQYQLFDKTDHTPEEWQAAKKLLQKVVSFEKKYYPI